jgi:hypothetical protein
LTVEVVAVRWFCWACDASVITAPERLPGDWFELPAPPWRAHHRSRFCCPDHAREGRDLHRRQWAKLRGQTVEVSVEEYERVRHELQQAAHQLDRLKLSAQRDGGREV